jgi:hypothetical protein
MANPISDRRNQSEASNLGQTAEEVRNRIDDLKTRAETSATGLIDKARETASDAYQKAGEAASAAGHKAESAVSAAGSGMTSLAGTIREKMPHEGVLGTTSETVANKLETGGRYLQEEGLGGMFDDMANVIRRNPVPALLVGIGIGFLLARSLRS